MSKYVLIGFSDGDARVYDPDGAEEQMQANGFSDVRRTELARGNDKRVLIEMAVLARGSRDRNMVDMIAECGDRQVALWRIKKGGAEMSKFVMVKFSDKDYRVYMKRTANKRKLSEWHTSELSAEVVAEGTDKDALIAMARIAREEFVKEWTNETDLVDRADALDQFP